jgi:hypothetical protein
MIISIACSSALRIYWVFRLLAIPSRRWFAEVAAPCLLVGLSGFLAATAAVCLLPPSLPRLLLATALTVTVSLLTTWSLALNGRERELLTAWIRRCAGSLRRVQP